LLASIHPLQPRVNAEISSMLHIWNQPALEQLTLQDPS
jgi:hypothetical protein